jgi:hypothetical protein
VKRGCALVLSKQMAIFHPLLLFLADLRLFLAIMSQHSRQMPTVLPVLRRLPPCVFRRTGSYVLPIAAVDGVSTAQKPRKPLLRRRLAGIQQRSRLRRLD